MPENETASRGKGRPSTYTPEIAAEILDRLSAGEPLAKICRDAHMPAVRTVSDWKKQDATFSADFARAREEGFEQIAADCVEIADDTAKDTISTSRGDIPNSEWISRTKVRVETRLKLLSKWYPKVYGDKLDVTGIPGGGPNITIALDDRIRAVKERRGLVEPARSTQERE